MTYIRIIAVRMNEVQFLTTLLKACVFYVFFLNIRERKTAAENKHFLSHINIPKCSRERAKLCKKDLYDSLKSMKNGKSLGNDG